MKTQTLSAIVGFLALSILPAFATLGAGQAPGAPSLDFDFFKARVQPIFTAKRPGHARCISCHVAGTPLRLQPFSPGSSTWNDEESRKNFDAMKRVVAPGNLKSKLLLHPLAEKAGGDFFHNGGKHWTSQNDPEWQTVKAWVMGETKTGSER